jgi:hypothetical protein
MYKLLKPLKWLEKETGKVLEFTGSCVSKCGKKIEDLGEDILKSLEQEGYIAKHTSNTGAAEPKINPVQFDEKKGKK